MFRACELKDQTYKKTRTLHFSEKLPEIAWNCLKSPERGPSKLPKIALARGDNPNSQKNAPRMKG